MRFGRCQPVWVAWSLRGLAGQGADLDQVVGEYPVPAPDRGSVPAVQAGAVPAVATFEVADPSFGAGAPLDQPAEAAAVLDCLAGWRGLGLAGDHDGAHAEGVQVAFDGGLAVAAVGGDRARHAARAAVDRSMAGASCGPSAAAPYSTL